MTSNFLLRSVGRLWLSGMRSSGTTFISEGRAGKSLCRRTRLSGRIIGWRRRFTGHKGNLISSVRNPNTPASTIGFTSQRGKERPSPRRPVGKSHSRRQTSWLVFSDRWGGGTGFQRKLEERGAVVHFVRFGEKFAVEETVHLKSSRRSR